MVGDEYTKASTPSNRVQTKKGGYKLNKLDMMMARTYTPVWNKYRPAILKMMIDSTNEPQKYQLSNHEFKALNPKQKGGYTFDLKVSGGKAINGLKESVIAQDLWEILQLSPKASEMILNSSYQFTMDKQFILHINKVNL